MTVVLITCSGYCYAASIKITADYKHYDRYRNVLIAKGNVVVTGPDFRITSPYVIRYYDDDKILAMDKFEFEKEGYKISGSNLEYYYWLGTGNAEKARINFGETFLGCRYMNMTSDDFELFDAYFTGCDLPTTHYHISAQQLSLYPNTGLIVAYYATCWVWTAPVIPVPTFVYSAPVPKSNFKKPSSQAAQGKATSSTAKRAIEENKPVQPVPQLGSNAVDGLFIKQGFNWYFNPRWYLKSILSYSEYNKGGLGLKTNYNLFGEMNEGEIRLGSTYGEGNFGGITHYISLGPRLTTDDDEKLLVYDFYKPGGRYSYELELKYSYRERPNLDNNVGPFSRVSFTPKVTLRSNRKPIPFLGEPFTYFWEVSRATVSEEVLTQETTLESGYTTTSSMTNYYADITYKNDFGWFGDFNLMFDINNSDYEKLGSWDRARQILSLQQKYFDRLTLAYGYVHYIEQRGQTPYLFEGYYYSPYDLFTGSIKIDAWFSYLQMNASYNLPSWDPFDITYEWLWGQHCYNLKFQYSVMRKEFDFSFELVPSRW